ncbi:transglutaminase family protein [Tianweitania sp. BSSL-BM11]|uniref:Transglutaminase family protein n=1 Tax=Tianweitania aestuarii TaxID=2814886 RepID=A0ABS5RW05_9HYPH|nr:transglutaminase family protein [Tianweitania aestuarii]MBS9720451.1 transglutaminase family protein [Tianweitania aestuarii]
MRLKITHKTEYSYDQPNAYALQRLRLIPGDSQSQRVLDWSLEVSGATEEVGYTDSFGNVTRLFSVNPGETLLSATATGLIETVDRSGLSGPHRGYTPLWLFRRETPLTAAGEAIKALAADVPDGAPLQRMHALLQLIVERIAYESGSTTVVTTAEEAANKAAGVCQDQAHIFASAARLLQVPARYVSGYLMAEDDAHAASHAWAEAHIDGLGWVAFDPANGISPDERYVRLAVGRDYSDASPVSGFRLGQASERLEVHVTVEQ